MWVDSYDGFVLCDGNSFLNTESIWSIKVTPDTDNLLDLEDPYCISVTYHFIFDESEYEYYNDMLLWMKNYYINFLKIPIFHRIDVEGDVYSYSVTELIVDIGALRKEIRNKGNVNTFNNVMQDVKREYRSRVTEYQQVRLAELDTYKNFK